MDLDSQKNSGNQVSHQTFWSTLQRCSNHLLTLKVLLLVLLTSPTILSGDDCYTAEFRAGWFFITEDHLRKIYGNTAVDLEIQGTMKLCDETSLWINASDFHQKGQARGAANDTKIKIRPLSVGLKYTVPVICSFDIYLGAGASYTWVQIYDQSPFVTKYTHEQAWGFVGKGGILYHITEWLYLDLYADYYTTRLKAIHSATPAPPLKIGGVRTGLGLGVNF